MPTELPLLPDLASCCSPVTGGRVDDDGSRGAGPDVQGTRRPQPGQAALDDRRGRGPGGVRLRPHRSGRAGAADDLPPHEGARRRRPGGARAARQVGLLQPGARHPRVARRRSCRRAADRPRPVRHNGPTCCSRGEAMADVRKRSVLDPKRPMGRTTPVRREPLGLPGQGRHRRHDPDAVGDHRLRPDPRAAPLRAGEGRARQGTARAAGPAARVAGVVLRPAARPLAGRGARRRRGGRPTSSTTGRSRARTARSASSTSSTTCCRPAIRKVSEDAGGRDVHLVGWCMGGLLSIGTASIYRGPADPDGRDGGEPVRHLEDPAASGPCGPSAR